MPAVSASWVIRDRESGRVIAETFSRKIVDALNTEKYEAVPILEYLAAFNNSPEVKATSVVSQDRTT